MKRKDATCTGRTTCWFLENVLGETNVVGNMHPSDKLMTEKSLDNSKEKTKP